jgi:hypothetical protein
MGGIASKMLNKGHRAVSCHPIDAGDGVTMDRGGLAPGDGAVPRDQRPGLTADRDASPRPPVTPVPGNTLSGLALASG